MWSLIIALYTMHGVGITHVDNFVSRSLCEQAKIKMEKTMLKTDYYKYSEIKSTCVLEIN